VAPDTILNDLQFHEFIHERFPQQQSSLSAKLLERPFGIGDWRVGASWRMASQAIVGSRSRCHLLDS
jgi:hypothetical protein